MRLRIAGDHHAALAKLRNGIGRRRFNPIHLVGQKGGGARIGFRDRQQYHAIKLRLISPIGVIARIFSAFTRHKARHAEGAGAGWFTREGVPSGFSGWVGSAQAFPLRRARHEKIGQVDRQQAVRFGCE